MPAGIFCLRESGKGDHVDQGRAEGRAAGRDEGKIEVYYTEMNLSVEAIAEKLSMEKEAVRKILAQRGILKEETPV